MGLFLWKNSKRLVCDNGIRMLDNLEAQIRNFEANIFAELHYGVEAFAEWSYIW